MKSITLVSIFFFFFFSIPIFHFDLKTSISISYLFSIHFFFFQFRFCACDFNWRLWFHVFDIPLKVSIITLVFVFLQFVSIDTQYEFLMRYVTGNHNVCKLIIIIWVLFANLDLLKKYIWFIFNDNILFTMKHKQALWVMICCLIIQVSSSCIFNKCCGKKTTIKEKITLAKSTEVKKNFIHDGQSGNIIFLTIL